MCRGFGFRKCQNGTRILKGGAFWLLMSTWRIIERSAVMSTRTFVLSLFLWQVEHMFASRDYVMLCLCHVCIQSTSYSVVLYGLGLYCLGLYCRTYVRLYCEYKCICTASTTDTRIQTYTKIGPKLTLETLASVCDCGKIRSVKKKTVTEPHRSTATVRVKESHPPRYADIGIRRTRQNPNISTADVHGSTWPSRLAT